MKKGIVLFTTLLMIVSLTSVMMIFLNSTAKSKNDITEEFALLQTNNIMSNLTSYFQNIPFDEETIFYGSKLPFSLSLENGSLIKFNIDSAHKYLNINLLAEAMKKKDNEVYDNFLSYLYKYRLRDPVFFVDLLIDTMDIDNIEKNSGSHSEIVIENPIFRNGKIYDRKHFNIIVDYYYLQTNDKSIYEIPFEKIISFESSFIDINFANKEVLEMLFPDADTYSLDKIVKYNEIYEKIDDLPFDKYYIEKISKGRLGHSLSTLSTIIKVDVEFKYKSQFISKLNFLYDTKAKTLSDYTIVDIEIYK